MYIMIVAHFCDDLDVKGNNRFNYLAELLSKRGHHVELITSSFSHTKKAHRGSGKTDNSLFRTTLISEPAYAKNVSLRRLYSHHVMARNLEEYLIAQPKPDIIYCAVPSLAVASCAVRYAVKRDIRLIVDVQDLWPEAFQLVFNVPMVSSAIFGGMHRAANEVYASADTLIAVSNDYLSRAAQVNQKCDKGYCVYLGTELDKFDREAATNEVTYIKNNEIWLAYVGTMGHSYDLQCVIDAVEMIQNKTDRVVRLMAMGDGPHFEKFKLYAKEKGITSSFPGRIDYGKLAATLQACDIAVNPICAGARSSIINKHADYAAAGLPVVSTQESLEYRSLLDTYSAGLNCKVGCASDVAEKLLYLINNEGTCRQIGENSRKMAEELFDRKKTYVELCNVIEQVH